jgi:hypothetical protein
MKLLFVGIKTYNLGAKAPLDTTVTNSYLTALVHFLLLWFTFCRFGSPFVALVQYLLLLWFPFCCSGSPCCFGSPFVALVHLLLLWFTFCCFSSERFVALIPGWWTDIKKPTISTEYALSYKIRTVSIEHAASCKKICTVSTEHAASCKNRTVSIKHHAASCKIRTISTEHADSILLSLVQGAHERPLHS